MTQICCTMCHSIINESPNSWLFSESEVHEATCYCAITAKSDRILSGSRMISLQRSLRQPSIPKYLDNSEEGAGPPILDGQRHNGNGHDHPVGVAKTHYEGHQAHHLHPLRQFEEPWLASNLHHSTLQPPRVACIPPLPATLSLYVNHHTIPTFAWERQTLSPSPSSVIIILTGIDSTPRIS